MDTEFQINEQGGWIVPPNTKLANETVVPAHSVFGRGCTLGDECTLGDRCKLGDRCELGDGCNWLGGKVESFLTVSNVDGTGRQVKLVKHAGGEIAVEAGCFKGTVAEFVNKAEDEGKTRYVAVIQAIVEAMRCTTMCPW